MLDQTHDGFVLVGIKRSRVAEVDAVDIVQHHELLLLNRRMRQPALK
jgi:hypothetical protein